MENELFNNNIKIYKGDLNIVMNKYLGKKQIYDIKDFFEMAKKIGFVYAIKRLIQELLTKKKEYKFYIKSSGA